MGLYVLSFGRWARESLLIQELRVSPVERLDRRLKTRMTKVVKQGAPWFRAGHGQVDGGKGAVEVAVEVEVIGHLHGNESVEK